MDSHKSCAKTFCPNSTDQVDKWGHQTQTDPKPENEIQNKFHILDDILGGGGVTFLQLFELREVQVVGSGLKGVVGKWPPGYFEWH